MLERWRERDVFAPPARPARGTPSLELLRGPADRERQARLPPRALARVFKDIYPRYRAMRGYYVPRKAGWDCHGLPVELEVEKELGISSKEEIEAYGIAEFNAALPRVGLPLRRGLEPADRADRLLDRPRRPLPDARQRLHRVGLVVAAPDLGRGPPLRGPQGRALLPALRHRAVLARGRAGLPGRRRPVGLRAAAGHRGAARRRDPREPDAARRLPAGLDDDAVDADLPRRGRRRAPRSSTCGRGPRVGRGLRASRERSAERVLGEGAEVARAPPGRGARGRPLRGPVRLRQGRGLRPARPLGAARRLRHHRGRHRPRPHGARLRRGRLPARRAARDDAPEPGPRPTAPSTSASPTSRASSSTSTTRRSSRRCARRGRLFRAEDYEHAYPHCWRCDTPLLYYAKSSWYIRTTEVRDRMLAENETIGWHPEHIKHGRFGKWLEGNVDWALSRERYWGTPLPIWECEAADCDERSAPARSPTCASAAARSPTTSTAPTSTRSPACTARAAAARCAASPR